MPPKKKPARSSSLANQLREIIDARGLNPHEIAIKAKINPSAMTRFKSRERDLSLPTFEKVCKALGLKVKLTEPSRPKGDKQELAPEV
jgi:hypothetical protein